MSEAQLQKADRRKDEFIATLAHELRNPLAPIRTGLELIRVCGNSPASVERVRSMMDRQVGHMVRLIDDLLDVSRVTRGKISLQREPTALSSLVTNAVDASRAAIAAKRITLNVELPDSTCVVDVDPTRFLQVISNLLDNATKFTDSGGTISIRGHVNGKDRSEGPTQLSNADATVRRQWVDGRPLNAKAVTIPVATRSKGVRSRGTETIAAGCPV